MKASYVNYFILCIRVLSSLCITDPIFVAVARIVGLSRFVYVRHSRFTMRTALQTFIRSLPGGRAARATNLVPPGGPPGPPSPTPPRWPRPSGWAEGRATGPRCSALPTLKDTLIFLIGKLFKGGVFSPGILPRSSPWWRC